ncbi:multidrug effflux MFS transporter [Yoonia sp. R2331]|uniref:multidrug effflux MFS transporter n=1 Tax=Yoonia sp. R2331 TaxID=3237238 RepID=UPI0034E452EA
MNAPTKRLHQTEFIALMAMLAATVAFSIDAMLPALPEIAAELSPGDANRAQLIITSFVLGMGLGTFVTGPLADTFGRKPVLVGGALLYCASALLAWAAQSLEVMLAARVLQGIGAAGPRVATMAMIRDLYAGPNMARILSFVMVVFSLVPALAPTMGHFIIEGLGWRAIFLSFVTFSVVTVTWLLIRQPETSTPETRRPLNVTALLSAAREVLTHPTTRLSIIIQTLTFGMLFTGLSSTQQVFDVTFDQGDVFHFWFGGIAVVAATGSLLNARLVVRLGMRAIIRAMFMVQIAVSIAMITITLMGGPYWLTFGIYVIWVTTGFYQAGLTIGNLNALAMEPLPHIAGMAASLIAAISTVGAVIIAAPIGLAFDGTPVPIGIGVLICAVLAFWLTTRIKRPGEE